MYYSTCDLVIQKNGTLLYAGNDTVNYPKDHRYFMVTPGYTVTDIFTEFEKTSWMKNMVLKCTKNDSSSSKP